MLLVQGCTEKGPSLLDDIKTIVEIIGTAVTAAAVVIGGSWAYFKFVKGRTYRPRLEVGLSGQWRPVDERHLLQARISVKKHWRVERHVAAEGHWPPGQHPGTRSTGGACIHRLGKSEGL